jgi:type II secretory pathway pseudopilin PulG
MTRRAHRSRPAAFSLIEVVAAVGVFAIGMVGVISLLAPVTQSIATVSDAEAAARVADAVRARVQALGFTKGSTFIQDIATVRKNDADPAYNPNAGAAHPQVLFGKLSGEVAFYDATAKTWRDYDYSAGVSAASASGPVQRTLADVDKFFEIDLIRNETLSPKANDATAPLIAYVIRVRWPAFVATSASTAVQSGQNAASQVSFDQSKKQVLFLAGTLQR